jgi:membrane-bound inhibitor of C-type lysozyme
MMMRTRPGRRAGATVLALVALALSSCTGDDGAAGTATVKATTASTAKAASKSTPAATSKAATATATPVVVRYLCDEGKTFEARVFPVPAQRAIVLVNGRTYDMPQTISASGIRYSDGNLVFHSKGSDAFIEEGGVMTYTNCKEQ